MIERASELLEAFITEEMLKVQSVDMPHMPTLGQAYEEITKKGIDREYVIPKPLGLKVVSGFVSMGKQMLPQQIDCMLVYGEGNQYGLTSHYIYPIEQVICIFEVKKTLDKNSLIDSFNHLGNIRRSYSEYFEVKLGAGGFEPNIAAAQKHFAQLTGSNPPDTYLGIHELSKANGLLFYVLVQESLAPLTIVHGFGGYRSERGLRKSFVDIIDEKRKESNQGLGIPSFPSLIISNDFSLVKTNGFPFLARNEAEDWAAVCSVRYNPARLILEQIWSKIAFEFDVRMPWKDGLHQENLYPLLVAKPSEDSENPGWIYRSIEVSKKALERDEHVHWEPSKLTVPAVTMADLMMARGGFLKIDQELSEYISDKYDVNHTDVVDEFLDTTYFFIEDGYLRPVSSETFFMDNDDGSGYVSNNIERFTCWCEANDIEPLFNTLFFVE